MRVTWQNELGFVVHGNALEVMREAAETWSGQFDLVFVDPPFNIGQDYDEYIDLISPDAFEEFNFRLATGMQRMVRPGGILIFHVPDAMVYTVLRAMDRKDRPFKQLNWLIWNYRFGQYNPNAFTVSKCHGLVYRREADFQDETPAKHTFNAADILVASDRTAKYKDDRSSGERVPLDVINIENYGAFLGRVQGNNSERVEGHPNQLPEKYLEIIIAAYTNPGDLVFDPCGGTGTAAVVANAMGRRWITCDISATYCEDIAARV